MTRRNKRKKKKTQSFNWKHSFLKHIVSALLLIFVLFVGVRKIIWIIEKSSYFAVKNVVSTIPLRDFDYETKFLYLKGKNIFKVNLKELQKQLQWAYPQAAKVSVLKKFPNTIILDIKVRLPFALAHINRKSTIVDKRGFVISKKPGRENLPIIKGIPYNNEKILVGRGIPNKSLSAALNILDEFARSPLSSDYKIKEIVVSNLSRIYFILKNGLRVIIDQEDVRKKLKTLNILFGRANLNIKNIRYIDLRFKEPVIKKE